MTDLTVGDIHVEPGETDSGWIEGVELTTTDRVDIPVMAMNGTGDGPTVLLLALQDGTEIQNVPTVHRIMREEVSPEELNGQLIGVPVANPLALMTATYDSWIDTGNVQGKTIDNPHGEPTERLTSQLWEEAYSQADMVLNYHSNTRPDSMFYQAFFANADTRETGERLAEAFGLTTVFFDPLDEIDAIAEEETHAPNTLRNKGLKEGIPELLIETVDGRWISEPSQTSNIEGTLNVFREFDLIDGESKPGHEIQSEQGIDIIQCRYTGGSGVNRAAGMLRAEHGGIIHFEKEPGEPIEEGEVVAEITDIHGETVEQLEMPNDGYVWAYPCSQSFGSSGLLQTIEEGGSVGYTFTHESE